MAQNSTPRRFYIDHAEDHAVVRTVQVQRPKVVAPVEDTPTQPITTENERIRPYSGFAFRARVAPRAVTGLVRSARKHAHRP